MTATAAPPRPRTATRTGLVVAVLVVVGVALLVVVMLALRGPAMVDTVTVVNRTGAPVTVAASGAEGDSVLPLGTVGGAATMRFADVVDQGDAWRFRLSVGPDGIGEIHRTRAQLDHDGWRVTVPRGAADRLPADRR